MSLSLTILGSSSALPTSKRFLTAHLVNHDERFFLLDCGEGTQIQLRRFGNKMARINHIFISHLHGDHVFGIFGLLSTMNMHGRKTPLHIYSHPKLEEIITSHLNYFNDDIKFPIHYHHIGATKSQILYEDNKLEISTIPLKHRIPCVGFLIKEKPKLLNIRKETIEYYNIGVKQILSIKQGNDFITENGKVIPNSQLTYSSFIPKSYVYCTDTKPLKSILTYIKGVDILYHEATFLHKDAKLAKQTYHSTAQQAAEIASEAKVGQLVIGHFSSRYKNDNEFLTEAKEVFKKIKEESYSVMLSDFLDVLMKLDSFKNWEPYLEEKGLKD